MGKIDKKDLARGTKLSTEHVWDNNLDAVATNINDVNPTTIRAGDQDGMVQPQYETGNGTFRITWTLPQLTSRWTQNNGSSIEEDMSNSANRGIGQPYIIPFVIPPFQEFLTFNGISDYLTPQTVLTEFSFGFDTRDEPAMITDSTCGPGVSPVPGACTDGIGVPVPLANGPSFSHSQYVNSQLAASAHTGPAREQGWIVNQNHGKLFYNFETRGDLKFSILSKHSQHFNPHLSIEDSGFTESLYKLDIPMAGFIGQNIRFNPHIEKDLNIPFDPHRTYALGILPPQLHDPTSGSRAPVSRRENLALVNLTISMKFKQRLVTRDYIVPADATRITGQPSDHGGNKTRGGIVLTKPGVNATIQADTAAGLNTTLTDLDTAFRNKLNSGYDVSSNTPVTEELCQDAGYDIIAIPMWNNQWNNVFTMRHGTWGKGTYHPGGMGATAANKYLYMDMDEGPMVRAIVPIDYPMTIHHCFLAFNNFTANFGREITVLGGTTPMPFDIWAAGPNGAPKPAYPWDTLLAPGPPVWGGTDAHPVHDIGIGIGTGRQGMQYGYRQLLNYANLDLNNPGNSSYCMDNIIMDYAAQAQYNAAAALGTPGHLLAVSDLISPAWRMFNLPLNGESGAGAGNGSGYFTTAGIPSGLANVTTAQDSPHFVGQSFVCRDKDNYSAGTPITTAQNEGTSVRFRGQTSGDGDGMGRDQWIEVRWKMQLQNSAGAAIGWNDVCGDGSGGGTPTIVNQDDSKIIHGVGGHWLYLVVKKQTVSNANWQNTNLKGGM